MLSQHVNVTFPFTVEEIVHMGAGDTGRAAAQRLVDAALGEVGLTHFSHRQLPTLSGGEQQRAHFARVLVQLACGEALHGPGLLLLDEPTSSLDMRHQIDLVETARRRAQNGTAVIAVLHDLNLAMRFADRIVLLHRGKLAVDGGRTEAITAETIRRIFEVDVDDRLYRAGRAVPAAADHAAGGVTPHPLSNGDMRASQNCQPTVTSAPQDTAHRQSQEIHHAHVIALLRRVRLSGHVLRLRKAKANFPPR